MLVATAHMCNDFSKAWCHRSGGHGGRHCAATAPRWDDQLLNRVAVIRCSPVADATASARAISICLRFRFFAILLARLALLGGFLHVDTFFVGCLFYHIAGYEHCAAVITASIDGSLRWTASVVLGMRYIDPAALQSSRSICLP